MSAQNIQPSSRPGKPTQQEIEKAGVLFFVVHECLSLRAALVRDLGCHQNLTLSEIEAYRIRSIPSEVENIILSKECLERFGPAVLRGTDLFYSFSRKGSVCSCLDWSDVCHCHLETWRLDVQPLYERGLILPIRDRRYGFYTDLMVFRHCRDEKPFVLQLRADQELAA